MDLKDQLRPMERGMSNVLLSVLTAAVIGSGSISIGIYKQVGVMQYQLDDLRARASDYLTRTEADERAKVRDAQFYNIEGRVTVLENKSNRRGQ